MFAFGVTLAIYALSALVYGLEHYLVARGNRPVKDASLASYDLGQASSHCETDAKSSSSRERRNRLINRLHSLARG